ncbi:MAG: hypothetical protein Q9227_007319 [Pyrenula ochraceoflavens]
MPPWNPILGHLSFCYRITSTLPKDAHPNYLPDMIRRELPDLGPTYYLDTWPFGPQMLVVGSTDGLYQITQAHSLPKYPALKEFLRPIAGGLDLVTMEGEAWKMWRGVFNPGFSANHLMTLTSNIVEETEVFVNILRELSQTRKLFRMKDLTDNLTMDIIGRVAMNTELDSQRRSNSLVDALRMQVKWLTFGADVNPLTRYNPLRPLVHRYNSWRMNDYVIRVIDRRFKELRNEAGKSFKGNKSILDLVLSTYLSEPAGQPTQDIDPIFKDFTMNQIKLFLFSGHDTTSGTVCYIFYVLATKPDVLAKICSEHDVAFASDTSKAASTIKSDSFILNRLPYTTAAIKEVMRLYPAVSGTRVGEPIFDVTDDTGRRFPTDGFLVWDNPQAVHRDPQYWPEPDEFVPERWLVAPGNSLHPVKETLGLSTYQSIRPLRLENAYETKEDAQAPRPRECRARASCETQKTSWRSKTRRWAAPLAHQLRSVSPRLFWQGWDASFPSERLKQNAQWQNTINVDKVELKMSTVTKVALAGATGNLGPTILSALLSANFHVTVLTRSTSNNPGTFPPNVAVTPVDYSSLPSLTAALQDHDAIVSTIATAAISAQTNLVHAASAAGIKRFIPSEFGSDTSNPKARQLPCFRDKVLVQDLLKQEAAKAGGMTYTFVCTGPFLDWGVMVGFLMNVKGKSITLYDGGERRFSASRLSTIGKAVASSLQHLDETKNRSVYVHDTAKTLREFEAIGQKATEGKEEWKESVVSVDKVLEGAYKELEKGGEGGALFLEFVKASIWGEGFGGWFEKVDNEMLGIPEMNDGELQAMVDGIVKQ